MDLILDGVVAGVLGTLAMDLLNHLFARIGVLLKIEVATIGRLVVGWTRGRFRYDNPDEIEDFPNEKLYGFTTHYLFGVGIAAIYIFCWNAFIGGPASPIWALVYGVSTTAVSYFFVYPLMGLGALGRRHPEKFRAALSPLANHLFYGVGLSAGIALM